MGLGLVGAVLRVARHREVEERVRLVRVRVRC